MANEKQPASIIETRVNDPICAPVGITITKDIPFSEARRRYPDRVEETTLLEVLAERERCASIVENYASGDSFMFTIAAEIRSGK